MAGNDIDHLKQQQAKLHHIRRFRAIVASPPPQVVVEKSIAHCCSIGATCVRDLDCTRTCSQLGGSWQPTRPLASGEMHGPALALAISARFAALHESLCGTKRRFAAAHNFRQLLVRFAAAACRDSSQSVRPLDLPRPAVRRLPSLPPTPGLLTRFRLEGTGTVE